MSAPRTTISGYALDGPVSETGDLLPCRATRLQDGLPVLINFPAATRPTSDLLRRMDDSRFALSAVKEHIALFGKPPKAYAYDRGGWSEKNVAELKKQGVRDPRGVWFPS